MVAALERKDFKLIYKTKKERLDETFAEIAGYTHVDGRQRVEELWKRFYTLLDQLIEPEPTVHDAEFALYQTRHHLAHDLDGNPTLHNRIKTAISMDLYVVCSPGNNVHETDNERPDVVSDQAKRSLVVQELTLPDYDDKNPALRQQARDNIIEQYKSLGVTVHLNSNNEGAYDFLMRLYDEAHKRGDRLTGLVPCSKGNLRLFQKAYRKALKSRMIQN